MLLCWGFLFVCGCYLVCLSFISHLQISILTEGRTPATRDPRRCLFASLLLKLLLLQKCNKFPRNGILVSVRLRRLRKKNVRETKPPPSFVIATPLTRARQKDLSWADTCKEKMADVNTPHDEFYIFLRDQQRRNTYPDATDSMLSYRCAPRELHCSRVLFVSIMF